jgi:hypothetical protein
MPMSISANTRGARISRSVWSRHGRWPDTSSSWPMSRASVCAPARAWGPPAFRLTRSTGRFRSDTPESGRCLRPGRSRRHVTKTRTAPHPSLNRVEIAAALDRGEGAAGAVSWMTRCSDGVPGYVALPRMASGGAARAERDAGSTCRTVRRRLGRTAYCRVRSATGYRPRRGSCSAPGASSRACLRPGTRCRRACGGRWPAPVPRPSGCSRTRGRARTSARRRSCRRRNPADPVPQLRADADHAAQLAFGVSEADGTCQSHVPANRLRTWSSAPGHTVITRSFAPAVPVAVDSVCCASDQIGRTAGTVATVSASR